MATPTQWATIGGISVVLGLVGILLSPSHGAGAQLPAQSWVRQQVPPVRPNNDLSIADIALGRRGAAILGFVPFIGGDYPPMVTERCRTASRWSESVALGPRRRVETEAAPKLAMSSRGEAIAIWGGPRTGFVAARRRSCGKPWRRSARRPPGANALVLDASGVARIALVIGPPGRRSVRIARQEPGRRWRADGQALRLSASALASTVQVVLRPNGAALAAWVEAVEGAFRVAAARRSTGTGSWEPPRFVSDALAAGPLGVAADLNARGDAVLAWAPSDVGQEIPAGRVAVREAAGSEWELGPPVAGYPSVAINGRGDGLAAWTVPTTGAEALAAGVYATTFRRSLGWTPARRLAGGGDDDAYGRAVGISATGRAVVALGFIVSGGPDSFAASVGAPGSASWALSVFAKDSEGGSAAAIAPDGAALVAIDDPDFGTGITTWSLAPDRPAAGPAR